MYENICLGRTLVTDNEYENNLQVLKDKFKTSLDHKNFCSEFSELFGIENKNYNRLADEEKVFIQSFFEQNPDAEFLARIYRDKTMARKTKVDSLIKSLGIEHLHGRNLCDDGVSVLGGKKERIAMSRFLTKENASVYIIDEPFTALDSKTEKECLTLLVNETAGKNFFVISHKFNVLKALTKRCIVLKNGKIIEEGTHEELKQNGKLYSELLKNFDEQRSEI